MISAFQILGGHVVPGPKFGLALTERREVKGFKTQSELARAVHKRAGDGDLPGDLRPFSQQWLSALEDDRTGEVIAGARPRLIRALAYMLGWSAAEFEEAVGVPVGTVPHFPNPRPILETPPTPSRPLDLPPGLQEAVEQFGGGIPELRDPEWQELLATSRFRGGGPETAQDWLEHFLHLKKFSRPRRG